MASNALEMDDGPDRVPFSCLLACGCPDKIKTIRLGMSTLGRENAGPHMGLNLALMLFGREIRFFLYNNEPCLLLA